MEKLKAVWRRLLAFYQPNPQPTGEFFKTWLAEMQKYNLEDVQDMATHIERHNTRFPALSEMIAAVDSIQNNRQQALWQATKAEERREAEDFWKGNKIHDDYGKKCLALIHKMLAGDMTKKNYLAGMRELGMLQEADDLEDYYARPGGKTTARILERVTENG